MPRILMGLLEITSTLSNRRGNWDLELEEGDVMR